jgi:phage-related minor tail protein
MASAKTIKGITIEIEGKTSGLVKALEEANKELSRTKSALKDVNDALKLDPGNADLIRQKQQLLADAIDETKKKLEAEKTAAKDAADALARGDISSEQYATLTAEVAKTTKELEALEKQARQSASVLGEQFKAAGDKISGVGDKISGVGKALAPISGAAVAGFTAAIKTTADFESQMSKVEALSGSTADQMADLEAKAREMGASTKFSATEAGEAFEYMALAGWKAEDMTAGISGIMSLAAASGEDLATVSDIVTDALTAFGQSAEDAGHFADVLAAASSNSNTTVSMMGESFKYVAPLAGSLGYSVDDVAVALGLMANSGIKASQAGTSLRTILTNLASPSKNVADAMELVGVSLEDGEGNMLSFRDVLGQLREGFGQIKIPMDEFQKAVEEMDRQLEAGELTQEDYDESLLELMDRAYGAEGAMKAQAAAAIGGQRGLSALLAMVNASDADLEKLTGAIDGSAGAAEGMAEIMQDNLSGQLTILMSQLQELAISVGETLLPAIMKVVEGLQKFMDFLNGLDEDTKNTIVNIGLVVAALAPALLIIGKVISAVGAIVSGIGALLPVLTTVGTFITATAIPAIGGVIAALAPFLPVIAAVGLAIAAIIVVFKNWDAIVESFQIIWGAFTDWIGEKFEKAANFITELWGALKDGASMAWGHIKETITGAVDNIKQKAEDRMAKVKQTFEENGGGIKGAVAVYTEAIKGFYGGMFDKLDAVTGGKLGEILGKFKEKFGEIKQAVTDKLHELISGAATWGKDLIDNFVKGITDKIQAVRDAVGNVAQTVRDFIGFSEPDKGPLSNFHTFAPDMIDLFAKGITDNLGTIQGAMTGMAGTVAQTDYSGQLSEINNNLAGMGGQQMLYATINIGGDTIDSVVTQALNRNNYLSGGR